MTFLELVQSLADESGTGSGAAIGTVTGQTGRRALFVGWVRSAWRDLQNKEGAWRWMEAEFSGQTVVGDVDYLPASLGIASRFGEWLYGPSPSVFPWTIYLTSAGRSEEGHLSYVPWDVWRGRYRIGVPPSQKPHIYTIAPDNQAHLYGTPDAIYTVRGFYRKAPQTLAADSDTPEMPERFHDIIVDRALDYLGTHDESPGQVPAWSARVMDKMQALRRDQLPRIELGGPLA